MKIYSYNLEDNNLEIEVVEKIHFTKNNVIFETKEFYCFRTNVLELSYCSTIYELTENQIKKLKNKIEI